MKDFLRRQNYLFYLFSSTFIIILIQGCSFKLVDDYNAGIARETINVSKQVDKFYGDLLEMSYSERSYDTLKERYVSIEVNIRALVIQNKARPLNDESISISETTLKKWIKYKDKHKQNWKKYQSASGNRSTIKAEEIYKDALAKNHRKRFTRLFTAMSVAEEAKKMKSENAKDKGGVK